MKTTTKIAILTIALAIVTIPLGQLLWRSPEGLAFGVGVGFLVLGWPLVRRATRAAGVAALPVSLGIAFSLMQWWPHSNSHRVIGDDYVKLLLVDYGFHVTLMIAAAIMARFFLATLRRAAAARERTQPAGTPAIAPAA